MLSTRIDYFMYKGKREKQTYNIEHLTSHNYHSLRLIKMNTRPLYMRCAVENYSIKFECLLAATVTGYRGDFFWFDFERRYLKREKEGKLGLFFDKLNF